MVKIDELIDATGAYDCVECGKCTSVCPAAAYNPEFAPRLIVVKALEGIEGLSKEKDIWSCLTCEMCSDMCPYKVDYSKFVRGLREEALAMGASPVCSQGGLVQTMGRIMTAPDLKQNRLNWLTDDLKVADSGDVYFFMGCLPHLDIIFEEKEVKLLDIAKSAIKIMNHAGITPVVSKTEVCCGHDMLWVGDRANFSKLAKQNIENIKNSGAKQVVFTCAEGFRTFDIDYQDVFGDLGFEVLHISEFILDLIDDGKLNFKNDGNVKVTYHDSCRLGRHMGIYDTPRDILKEMPGVELVEMERIREKSACCGVSAFATCEASSKKMQIDRLMEGKNTGADKMLMFCPKCQIHFKCASWKEMPVEPEKVDIPIDDMTTFVAERLEEKGA
jgi:heterodisulfide reductase subunit D